MWWISYRGESGHGVDNIGVFEDDGSPRKKHPLLLDPSPTAEPLHMRAASHWWATTSILRTHGARTATLRSTTATETPSASRMCSLGPSRLRPWCTPSMWSWETTVASTSPARTLTRWFLLYRRHANPHQWPRISANTTPTAGFSPAHSSPPAGGAFPGTVTARRSMCRRLSASELFSTSTASHGIRCAASSCKKHLYVADEAGDSVKVFNVRSGELMARITGRWLQAPVHLILHGESLYIGASGTGSILALDLSSTPPAGEVEARVVIDRALDAPSGFAIGPDGDFYVAERKKQRVRRFSSKGKKKGTFMRLLRNS